MDTYGLIKFWDFDDGLPDGSINHSKTSKRGRPDFGLLPEDSMPSERGYKWRARLLQVPTPPYLPRPNLLSKVTSQADSINVSECRGFFLLFHSDFIYDYFKSLWYEVADEMSTRIEVEMEINFEKKTNRSCEMFCL